MVNLTNMPNQICHVPSRATDNPGIEVALRRIGQTKSMMTNRLDGFIGRKHLWEGTELTL